MDSHLANPTQSQSIHNLQTQNLNTRTMFFQPPPTLWHNGNLTQKVTSGNTNNNNYDNILNQTTTISKLFTEANDRRNSHNGAQLNSGSQSSDSSTNNNNVNQIQSQAQQQTGHNHNELKQHTPLEIPAGSPLYKSNGDQTNSPGYKRGTIITSAITSPTKGYSSRRSHSSALGVTSSSASSSSIYLLESTKLLSTRRQNCFNLFLAKLNFTFSSWYGTTLLYSSLYLLGYQTYIPIILLSLIHIYIL